MDSPAEGLQLPMGTPLPSLILRQTAVLVQHYHGRAHGQSSRRSPCYQRAPSLILRQSRQLCSHCITTKGSMDSPAEGLPAGLQFNSRADGCAFTAWRGKGALHYTIKEGSKWDQAWCLQETFQAAACGKIYKMQCLELSPCEIHDNEEHVQVEEHA